MSYGLQKHIYEPKACFLVIKNSAGAMQHHNGKTRQNIENIDIIKPFGLFVPSAGNLPLPILSTPFNVYIISYFDRFVNYARIKRV